jgi:hypothetical protein
VRARAVRVRAVRVRRSQVAQSLPVPDSLPARWRWLGSGLPCRLKVRD